LEAEAARRGARNVVLNARDNAAELYGQSRLCGCW
jgi:hypothetical protein